MGNHRTVGQEVSLLPGEYRWTDIDGTEYSALEEGAPTECGAMPAACREIFRLAKERDELLVRLGVDTNAPLQRAVVLLETYGLPPFSEAQQLLADLRDQLRSNR